MISGAHLLLFSRDSDADRKFFRDVLGFPSVDAGGGWLIFKLPSAEAALHPVDPGQGGAKDTKDQMLGAQLYLMCDDLQSVMKALKAKNVNCSPIAKERWGIRTSIQLPSGGEVGLYQPTHPTAVNI